MERRKPSYTEFWQLLELVEDYIEAGYRRNHNPPPGFDETLDSRRAEEGDSLKRIAAQVRACTACGLHQGRTHAVPGEGVSSPTVLVIGEGPGAAEDRSGRPFVGAAGRYLDKWLAAIDSGRETNAFIANIVKCRPPGNRDPLPEEQAACRPYLERQIVLLGPRVILTVGRIASQTLLQTGTPLGRLRGRVHTYREIPVVPTYHPSAVLRDQSLRKPVWEDLKRLMSVLHDG
jgi:DNA polymerase